MLLSLAASTWGCGGWQQAPPRIPNRVTSAEYEVYSAWLRKRFASRPPQGQIYISYRTMIFNAQERCGKVLRTKLGRDDAGLVDQFTALGEAEYRLDLYSNPPKLNFEFPFTPVGDHPPATEKEIFRLIHFSRVAFNAIGTVALLAFSDACGGLCGGGGAAIARKQAQTWAFEGTHCFWVY